MCMYLCVYHYFVSICFFHLQMPCCSIQRKRRRCTLTQHSIQIIMCQKVITLIGWKSIVVLRTLANVRPIWVWNMCTASLRHADGCWLLLVYLPPCVPTHIKIVLNLCIQINKSFINVYVCLCFVDFYSLHFCMYWVRAIYELRFLRDCALIERAVQFYNISVSLASLFSIPFHIG